MNACDAPPFLAPFDAPAEPYAPDLTLLAIGTSTERCSVAIWSRRSGVAHGTVIDSPASPGQSGLVLTWVRELLSAARLGLTQLDAIAFDAGPGAFTGLRIGCGVAQGLGFALGRPLVPVTSLAAMATPVSADEERLAVSGDRLLAIDARMQEVYWGILPVQADPSVLPIDIRVGPVIDAIRAFDTYLDGASAALSAGGLPRSMVALGNGFERVDALREWVSTSATHSDPLIWPDARRIALLGERLWRGGQRLAPADAAPVYIRNKVALDASEQAKLREANRQRSASGPPMLTRRRAHEE